MLAATRSILSASWDPRPVAPPGTPRARTAPSRRQFTRTVAMQLPSRARHFRTRVGGVSRCAASPWTRRSRGGPRAPLSERQDEQETAGVTASSGYAWAGAGLLRRHVAGPAEREVLPPDSLVRLELGYLRIHRTLPSAEWSAIHATFGPRSAKSARTPDFRPARLARYRRDGWGLLAGARPPKVPRVRPPGRAAPPIRRVSGRRACDRSLRGSTARSSG